MKKITTILFIATLLFMMVSCDDANKIDYIQPVQISFDGVGSNNIVQVAPGIMTYNAKISITSTRKIRKFSLYEANAKTGARGNQIGKDIIFEPSLESYSTEYVISGLTDNKVIEVVVEDEGLASYSKKLMVQITQKVVTSDLVTIETSEVYFGPYYASWNNGRVYLRSTGLPYKDEIDFSLGNIAITGTDTVPAFISPDKREELGLPFLPNVKSCKFELTTLSKVNYDAIPANDAAVIEALAAPTLTAIKAELGKVYLYENATERGLIYVGAIQAKKATLQQKDDSWLQNQTYHQLKIYTKTAPKK